MNECLSISFNLKVKYSLAPPVVTQIAPDPLTIPTQIVQ